MTDQRMETVERYAREVMGRDYAPELKIAHDFKHVDRVRRWALHLAEREGYAERALLETAALLHDIGLSTVRERRDHARVGAEMAGAFLRDHGLFAEHEVEAIADAIACHSSLEGGGQLGELLRDADMLDLFGAVGLMRAFTSKHHKPEYDPGAVKGETWELSSQGFTERLRAGRGFGPAIMDQINFQISCYANLTTPTARELAAPLVAFMRAFVLQLEAEVDK